MVLQLHGTCHGRLELIHRTRASFGPAGIFRWDGVSLNVHWPAIALCSRRRYIGVAIRRGTKSARSENDMRPEIERLVEEIKQSVGLLRRHL